MTMVSIHVTHDGGSTWERIAVEGLPEWTLITGIEVSPQDSKDSLCDRYARTC